MTTIYFRFADEAEAIKALSQFRGKEPIYEMQPTEELQHSWHYCYQVGAEQIMFISPAELTEDQMWEAAKKNWSTDSVDWVEISKVWLSSAETQIVMQPVQVGVKDVWVTSSHEHFLDVVGTIYKPTGKVIEGEYGPVEETAPVAGFHINYVGVVPKEAEAFVIKPVNPQLVMA